eukprot:3750305-Rhodomonas_salina.1
MQTCMQAYMHTRIRRCRPACIPRECAPFAAASLFYARNVPWLNRRLLLALDFMLYAISGADFGHLGSRCLLASTPMSSGGRLRYCIPPPLYMCALRDATQEARAWCRDLVACVSQCHSRAAVDRGRAHVSGPRPTLSLFPPTSFD